MITAGHKFYRFDKHLMPPITQLIRCVRRDHPYRPPTSLSSTSLPSNHTHLLQHWPIQFLIHFLDYNELSGWRYASSMSNSDVTLTTTTTKFVTFTRTHITLHGLAHIFSFLSFTYSFTFPLEWMKMTVETFRLTHIVRVETTFASRHYLCHCTATTAAWRQRSFTNNHHRPRLSSFMTIDYLRLSIPKIDSYCHRTDTTISISTKSMDFV